MAEYITCFEAEEGVSRANFNSRIEQINSEFDKVHTEKGAAGGTATLDQNGKLVQMPSASDIGAAPKSHSHSAGEIASGVFDAARIPALVASKITTGTFATTDVAAAAGTDYTSYRIRNIAADTVEMTASTTAMANGNIYLQYE